MEDYMLSTRLVLPTDPKKRAAFTMGINEAVVFDLATGRVRLDAAKLHEAATLMYSGKELQTLTRTMGRIAELGVATIKGKDGNIVPLFPWAIIEPLLADHRPLPIALIRDLGVGRARSLEDLDALLTKRFGRIPDILSTEQVLSRLLPPALKRRNEFGGQGDGMGWIEPDSRGVTGSPGFPAPEPPLPDWQTCLTAMSTFESTPWELRICMSDDCARAVGKAIEQNTLAGSFENFVKFMVDTASAASSSSMAGFVVKIALTMYGGLLNLEIYSATEASRGRGVCFHFCFVWWCLVPPYATAK